MSNFTAFLLVHWKGVATCRSVVFTVFLSNSQSEKRCFPTKERMLGDLVRELLQVRQRARRAVRVSVSDVSHLCVVVVCVMCVCACV